MQHYVSPPTANRWPYWGGLPLCRGAVGVFYSPSRQAKPYQVLPLQARVDLGAMAMKGYSAFPKAPALLEPHHQIV